MELQAIRKKLETLQETPRTLEAVPEPWSQAHNLSREVLHNGAQQISHHTQVINQNRPAMAIEALKEISNRPKVAEPATTGNQVTARQRQRSSTDRLVAEEMYSLENMANHINDLSEQLADELSVVQQAAETALITLQRQGISEHPQLEMIAQFVSDRSVATVPRLDKDAQGTFSLSYVTVSFNQAEQAANHIAQSLRERQLAVVPFAHPIQPAQSRTDSGKALSPERTPEPLSKSPLKRTAPTRRNRSLLHNLNRTATSILGTSPKHPSYHQPVKASASFSWLDGSIWFCGAAIARFLMRGLFTQYPILQAPLLVALAGAICVALYQIAFTKNTNFTLAYRLVFALLGLFLGGFF